VRDIHFMISDDTCHLIVCVDKCYLIVCVDKHHLIVCVDKCHLSVYKEARKQKKRTKNHKHIHEYMSKSKNDKLNK
jgi:hypothetical protein